MVEKIKQNKSLFALVAFCIVALVMILIGVFAVKVPVVAMCVLVILEAGIAVMMHKAELWLHGVMILVQLIAGIIAGRTVAIILCALVYAAATAALWMSDISDKEEQASVHS